MLSKILCTLSTVFTAVSVTNYTGAHAELDISIIEQAKDVYLDNILSYLNNLELPDVTSDDGKTYLHGNHVSVD